MKKYIEINGRLIVGFDKKKRETITRKVKVRLPEEMAQEIKRSANQIGTNSKAYYDKCEPFHLDGNSYYFRNHDKPHRRRVFLQELCYRDFTEEMQDMKRKTERERKMEEYKRKLPDILAQLPAKQRKRIHLYFWKGLSIREIAKTEGVHPSSVGQSIQLALTTIVNKL